VTDGPALSLIINGRTTAVAAPPMRRLSQGLRQDPGLTGTKVGCAAGDCAACTGLLGGPPVRAWLTPGAPAPARQITTVEGLANGALTRLQRSFHPHGAAQCGICTPGMLLAATALIERNDRPGEDEVLDALGGVLCRCTGYRKII